MTAVSTSSCRSISSQPMNWRRLAHLPSQPSSTTVWALLEESDAEALRTEIGAGHSRDAYDLLLNRAVEILPIAVAVPDAASKSLTPQ